MELQKVVEEIGKLVEKPPIYDPTKDEKPQVDAWKAWSIKGRFYSTIVNHLQTLSKQPPE